MFKRLPIVVVALYTVTLVTCFLLYLPHREGKRLVPYVFQTGDCYEDFPARVVFSFGMTTASVLLSILIILRFLELREKTEGVREFQINSLTHDVNTSRVNNINTIALVFGMVGCISLAFAANVPYMQSPVLHVLLITIGGHCLVSHVVTMQALFYQLRIKTLFKLRVVTTICAIVAYLGAVSLYVVLLLVADIQKAASTRLRQSCGSLDNHYEDIDGSVRFIADLGGLCEYALFASVLVFFASYYAEFKMMSFQISDEDLLHVPTVLRLEDMAMESDDDNESGSELLMDDQLSY
eukprot:TRINITY_DN11166_c0_g1_i1.p1 TRINITY_DN11166_c0_g1~~TRINITY_DN11166_c0_g1_i1.p1  ORF type:complete len:295 (-),score=41.75 TRINITY_DN11166_c0_g1_i1:266-1150(-)